jgi:thymidylate synthase ThyX
MTFYVRAPIFVFREFMRHRTFSYNEESGRYRELAPEFYVPGSACPSTARACCGARRLAYFSVSRRGWRME